MPVLLQLLLRLMYILFIYRVAQAVVLNVRPHAPVECVQPKAGCTHACQLDSALKLEPASVIGMRATDSSKGNGPLLGVQKWFPEVLAWGSATN